MDKWGYLIGSIAAIGFGIVVGRSWPATINSNTYPKMIPDYSHVQEGYVAPKRIEFSLEDLDGNGSLESYLSVDGKKYGIKEEEGKPTLVPNYK
ncbi:MAG: hypothetical protein WCV90_07550 [Candidatus Woesearchaeota archaeon]